MKFTSILLSLLFVSNFLSTQDSAYYVATLTNYSSKNAAKMEVNNLILANKKKIGSPEMSDGMAFYVLEGVTVIISYRLGSKGEHYSTYLLQSNK